MKSITKKISLLLIMSTVLFLSSCLDSGESSYFGTDEYSYITQTNLGKVYARTARGYPITSEKISLLRPGSAVLLTYQIDENTQTVAIEENVNGYKVMLGKEPITLNQEILQSQSAPDVTPVYFESIIAPPTWVTYSSVYFGDRWPFTYQYKAKKGEKVNVKFYQVSKDNHPENFDADILIDVRMEKTGTPETDAHEELKQDIVVANMSSIRSIASDVDSQESKQLSIKFRYYRMDNVGKAHISNSPIIMNIEG